MGVNTLKAQAEPSAPNAGYVSFYFDSDDSNKPKIKDENGTVVEIADTNTVGNMAVSSADIDFAYDSGAVTLTPSLKVTGVSANTYGDSTNIPVITVDTKGRITALSTAAASGGGSSSQVSLTGNISTTAWTTSGVRFKDAAATLTDTSSTGTVATAYSGVFGGHTIAASSATTFTNYFGMYFNEPTAGTNVTLTNKYALGAVSAKFGSSNQFYINSTGFIGIGTTPSTTSKINTSYSSTATSGNYTGHTLTTSHISAGANSVNLKGIWLQTTDSSDSGTTGIVYGIYNQVTQAGLASLTSVTGNYINLSINSGEGGGGTVTTAKGIDVSVSRGIDGSTATGYGIYIGEVVATTAYGLWQNATTTPNRFGSEVRIQGDTGGAASHNTFTGTSNVTANSTGVGSIKFKGTTSRDSSGFIKIYIGTTAYYVPVFSAITG